MGASTTIFTAEDRFVRCGGIVRASSLSPDHIKVLRQLDHPASLVELATSSGLDQRALHRALATLIDRGIVAREDNGPVVDDDDDAKTQAIDSSTYLADLGVTAESLFPGQAEGAAGGPAAQKVDPAAYLGGMQAAAGLADGSGTAAPEASDSVLEAPDEDALLREARAEAAAMREEIQARLITEERAPARASITGQRSAVDSGETSYAWLIAALSAVLLAGLAVLLLLLLKD